MKRLSMLLLFPKQASEKSALLLLLFHHRFGDRSFCSGGHTLSGCTLVPGSSLLLVLALSWLTLGLLGLTLVALGLSWLALGLPGLTLGLLGFTLSLFTLGLDWLACITSTLSGSG